MGWVGASEVLGRVSRIAAGQWGLLTAAQAEQEGVPRYRLARLAEAGALERVEQGIYAVVGTDTDQHRPLRAAWLALDPARTADDRLSDLVAAGVVSHASAAGLHGLGDLLDDVPEITLPTRKQTRRGIRLRRATLDPSEVTLVEGIPTTTVERTVADLLRDGNDLDHIAQIAGQAIREGRADRSELTRQLDPLARRYGHGDGTAFLEHLLDVVGLSRAALARELATSPAGRQLADAVQASTFENLFAMLPKLDIAHIFESAMPKIDFKLPNLMAPETLRSLEQLQKMIANAGGMAAIREAQRSVLSHVDFDAAGATRAATGRPLDVPSDREIAQAAEAIAIMNPRSAVPSTRR